MEARSLSNQQAMEQALGKLVMDGGFRDAFFMDPAVASEAAGIPLTDRERNALARIRPGALAAFQRYLDAKRVADCGRTQAQGVEDSPDDQ
jgi:hypothetical protein